MQMKKWQDIFFRVSENSSLGEFLLPTCGIKLRRIKKLPAIEEFRERMRRFM